MVTGAVPQATPGGSDPHRHLSTLDGWREFTGTTPGQPSLLPAGQYQALGIEARAAYDEERLDYHTRLGVVGTSVLRQVVTTGRRLTLLNRHAISARRGLILSGAAGTGKTTAITQLGKTHEATDRARHPGQERIPVIYVTVPPAATPRMLAMEFARFLGLPVPARANMTDIIEAVCGVAIDTSASMVLVDEIHNMQLATRSGAEVSDTLKYLSERIPATFVYAGIERRARRAAIRHARRADRRPVHHDPHRPLHPGPAVDHLDRRARGQPPAAPAPARHPPAARRLPAPAHPRDDRQPAVADPQRRGPGRHRRHRENHPQDPGGDPGRHRLAKHPARPGTRR